MILSSKDILNKLGSDAIVRSCARMAIVSGRPGFDTGEYLYIYIDQYPEVADFQATWKVWILDGGHEYSEIALEAIASILPGWKRVGNYYTTSDFLSENTVVKTETEIKIERLSAERDQIKKSFKSLSEGVEGAIKDVRDGRDGRDGVDGLQGDRGRAGRDGADGRDGRDIDATETDVEDLRNVDSGIPYEKGQVLTWDGTKWTNLFVPRSETIFGGSGGSGSGNIKVQERAGAAGDPENPVENVNTLSFNTNNGFSVTDLGEGEALVNLGSAFAPWHVEGQETLAPEGEEPVEFVAGDGISLVTDANADPKKLTIIATGGNDGGIPEAPLDGNYYVRKDGQWINMLTALQDLDVAFISGPDEIEYIEPE